MYFDHYKDVPKSIWKWQNFTPKEIASKGNNSILINEPALDMLQHARDIANKPLYINSAYRDEDYNKLVGGAPKSYHLQGRAFDISLKNFSKPELLDILEQAGFTGFGLNYKTFIHADNGKARRW